MIVLGYTFFGGDTDAHTAGVRLRNRMLRQLCGIETPCVRRLPAGKPVLDDRAEVTFSVSHTDNLAVCAVSFPGTADAGEFLVLDGSAASPEVGADAERIRTAEQAPRLRKIAARFFSPDAAARLTALPDSAVPRAFCEIWTAGESYVKMTGEGFGRGFSALSFDGVKLPMLTLRRGEAEYIVRAAWREDREQEERI